MSDKTTLKPLAIAMGAAFATSLAGTGVATAGENPFAMSDLSGGYMIADNNAKGMEGNCGGRMKTGEGMGGEMMKSGDDAGGKMMKSEEGKCGEGKCGEKRKAHEGKCGAAMPPAEGKCGASK
jgi:uncharacterized low-complexity protein